MGARNGRCSDGAAGWAHSAHTTVEAVARTPTGSGISQRQREESNAINTVEISLDPTAGGGRMGRDAGRLVFRFGCFKESARPAGLRKRRTA